MFDTIAQKIKDGLSWLKTKTKQILITLGIIGIAMAAPTAYDEIQILQIPDDLRLKVQKEQILYSHTFSEWDWEEGWEFDEELDGEIWKRKVVAGSERKIVEYAYKGDIAPPLENEVMEMRTPKTTTQFIRENKDKSKSYVQTSGANLYQEKGEGYSIWYHLKWHRIPEKEFRQQTESIFSYLIKEVFAVNTGWKSPEATGGEENHWTNGANAYSEDGSYASYPSLYSNSNNFFSNGQSYETFGFGIPGGATIDGVEIDYKCYWDDVSGGSGVTGYAVWGSPGTGLATAKSAAYPAEGIGNIAYIGSFGGAADLWGETPDDEDFADENFYAGFYANTDYKASVTPFVDHIQVKVYYTEAPESLFQINIGDAWKDVTKVEINIGDAWKDVTKMEINIGDAWKTIFSP